jgi:hypothetical protein
VKLTKFLMVAGVVIQIVVNWDTISAQYTRYENWVERRYGSNKPLPTEPLNFWPYWQEICTDLRDIEMRTGDGVQ